MKVYIMTDLEGCAGVINREDWVLRDSRYYEDAKILLTEEVNAAIEGLFQAGADEILVADGHGPGAINFMKLDPRVRLIRGFPDPYPFGLDASFDCMCHIGQHAKASTEKAHICHTGNQYSIDVTINDVSVGEFGKMTYCAEELNVASIFGSGDLAFTKEAQDLVEGIVTVSVKEGLVPGKGLDKTFEETINRNHAAIHIHPLKARELIRNGAYIALRKFIEKTETFKIKKPIQAPYECIGRYRASKDRPAFTLTYRHENSVIGLLNSKPERKDGVDVSDLL
ncbi:MAG TPA: hypothetical protein DDZ89_06640 [Clostridiales bacterium]|nr:hypothetical protein [Clostridiales bacterium]